MKLKSPENEPTNSTSSNLLQDFYDDVCFDVCNDYHLLFFLLNRVNGETSPPSSLVQQYPELRRISWHLWVLQHQTLTVSQLCRFTDSSPGQLDVNVEYCKKNIDVNPYSLANIFSWPIFL